MPEREPELKILPRDNVVGVASPKGTAVAVQVVHRFPDLWPLVAFVVASLGLAGVIAGTVSLILVVVAILYSLVFS